MSVSVVIFTRSVHESDRFVNDPLLTFTLFWWFSAHMRIQNGPAMARVPTNDAFFPRDRSACDP